MRNATNKNLKKVKMSGKNFKRNLKKIKNRDNFSNFFLQKNFKNFFQKNFFSEITKINTH